MWWLIVIGIVVIAILWTIIIYNKIVKLDILSKNAWSDIDVILKKRHNLIPNLVEAVKGYAAHEKETLERVIKARQMAVNVSSDDIEKRIKAENKLTQSLRSIMAIAESYPELKANQQFAKIMEELKEIESEIEGARRYYNAVVRDYNTKIKVFPNMFIASIIKAKEKPFYEIEMEGYRETPEVKF